jgi:hypothetical protein
MDSESPATPKEEVAASTENGAASSNGDGAVKDREAVRRRLRELGAASSFPEADEEVEASFSVGSAEGLRATFPGQDTEAGDQLVIERAEAAFETMRRKREREKGNGAGEPGAL